MTVVDLSVARSPQRLRTQITATAGLALAILPPLVVVACGPCVAALAAVLVFTFAGAGPGLMCWVDAGDGYAQAGLTVAVSLAAFAAASTTMIWLHAWTPSLLWILGAVSAASCLARLSLLGRGRRA
jgi:hypothetical protein